MKIDGGPIITFLIQLLFLLSSLYSIIQNTLLLHFTLRLLSFMLACFTILLFPFFTSFFLLLFSFYF